MRLNNISTQTVTNVLGAKGNGKKGYAIFKSFKVRLVASALALTTGLGATAAVLNTINNKADLPETPANTVTNTSETPSDTQVAEDKFGILADGLTIDVGMENTMLTVEEQAKKIAEEMGATYDGTTYEVKDDKGNVQTWVSEEDYNKADEAGIADSPVGTEVTTYDKEVFVATDGTTFWTKADRDAWNAHLEAEKQGTTDVGSQVVETEGNKFVAPDGEVWESEEEYNKYQDSNQGTVEVPVEEGTIIETGEGYRDPNGDYWTSEAEYLEYIRFNSTLDNTQDDYIYSTPEDSFNNGTNNGSDSTVIVDDNLYHAPDGTVWNTEQDYLDYTRSNTASGNTQDNYIYSTPEGSFNNGTNNGNDNTAIVDDNLYHAPDGTVWNTEQDYLDYKNNNATLGATQDTVETDNTLATDNTYTSNDGNVYENQNLYIAPDGTTWFSEEDYLAFTGNQTSAEETVTTETGTGAEETENKIEYDEYGGYFDAENNCYLVYDLKTGAFIGAFESKAVYLEILAMEAEEATKTR